MLECVYVQHMRIDAFVAWKMFLILQKLELHAVVRITVWMLKMEPLSPLSGSADIILKNSFHFLLLSSFVVVQDRVSLCLYACPGTHAVD